MEVYALGPVSAIADGRQVVTGSRQAARILGALATSRTGCVTRDELTHYVWGRPDVKEGTVAEALRALRGQLGGEVLPHVKSRTCSLSLPRENVDYWRFRDLVAKAAGLSPRRRHELLSAAMREWPDGSALHGLRGEGFRMLRAELRMEWREAALDRLDAALQVGEFEEVRKEEEQLRTLLGEEDPELFQCRLIALAELGEERKARELTTWWKRRKGRTSPALKTVIENVVAPRGGTRRWPRRGTPPPRQLPPAPRPLPGRAEIAAHLADDFLRQRHNGERCLALLSGMPGVGKSALALLMAERLAPHFPDAVLHLGLRGHSEHEEPITPDQLLDRVLSDLGITPEASDREAKSGVLRTALARQSVLMILDDAATADQVLPLLPGQGTSGVIITSRQRLPQLGAEHRVREYDIDPLPKSDAVQVLEQALSPERTRRVGEELAVLADLCGCLPLALVIVAELVRHRPVAGIRELVDELRQERTRLEAMRLPDGPLAVYPVLEYAVRALPPAAALLLWQAAIHPGPSISWLALRDLERVGCGGGTTDAIATLVSAHFLEPLSEEKQRFRMHDLVRVYARQHAGEHIEAADEEMAGRTAENVLEHELQQVWACDQVLAPDRQLPIQVSEVRVACPSEAVEAMALLDKEYDTAMAVVQFAIARRAEHHVWLLPMALVTYQWRRALYKESQHILQPAEFMARNIAQPVQQAMIHRMIAGCLHEQRAADEAAGRLEHAVSLSRRESHTGAGRSSLAWSLHSLGIVRRRQERPISARKCWEQARELFRDLGDSAGEAATLNALGTLHHDDEDYDGALRLCLRALGMFQSIEDTEGIANAVSTLAKVHLSRGEREPALASYAHAIRLYQELDDWRYEAQLQERYANALLSRREDRPRAVQALERALELRDQLGGEGTQELLDRLASLR